MIYAIWFFLGCGSGFTVAAFLVAYALAGGQNYPRRNYGTKR